MNEYGIHESWTKQFTVGPIDAFRLAECGRNLFEYDSLMYVYDQQKLKPLRDLIMENCSGFEFSYFEEVEVVNHIDESLVTIEGTKVLVKREYKKCWFRENFIFLFLVLILIVFIGYHWYYYSTRQNAFPSRNIPKKTIRYDNYPKHVGWNYCHYKLDYLIRNFENSWSWWLQFFIELILCNSP